MFQEQGAVGGPVGEMDMDMGDSPPMEKPSPFFWRWLNRIALIPILAVYVFVVYLTQYISWNGARGLLEQHAFLVPALKFELRR